MSIKTKRIIYLICTILITTFIFYNSMKNGEDSSKASMSVLNIINTILNKLGINLTITGHFVRKSAHFIEFFVFGIFIMLIFISFATTNQIFNIIGFPMFFAIFIPVIDEYIQLFSVGRASSVKDALLDFLGSICGILLVCIRFKIKNRKKIDTDTLDDKIT